MRYEELFRYAMGGDSGPYPYQLALAHEPLPDLLDIPTGLGKTAAVTLAWLYRRKILADESIPRRLVWCLPMRVLVEQTARNVRTWLERLDLLGAPGASGKITVHLLMGGERELRAGHWAHHPEQEAVLVGTQDMLLSRALMRGYGMSRYQWPVHFALLHTDTLWVYDEVQLMGAGLPTSAQLEAFRRTFLRKESRRSSGTPAAKSLWVSATLREHWLDTVDFRPHRQAGLRVLGLTPADRADPTVSRRLDATKRLERASSAPEDSGRGHIEAYVAALAAEVRSRHQPGTRTLAIINRVERAQALYRALDEAPAERLLLHARFRAAERRSIEEQLRGSIPRSGQIVIATQAVEAGVDISSRTLFTELAPWPSLVQRLGRCNRAGEHDDSLVRWIDLPADNDELALPYETEALAVARERLQGLTDASAGVLPPVEDGPASQHVLRRRDLIELFNTDPDLSGFDVDVSPYIRDVGSPQLQVFWRDFDQEGAVAQPGPSRDELCPVSVLQLRDHLGPGRKIRAWTWDPLHRQGQGGWVALEERDRVRPGQTLMLRAGDGGYEPNQGFLAGHRRTVPLHPEQTDAVEPNDSEVLTILGRWVPLATHLQDVAAAAGKLATTLALAEEDGELLQTAALWHDVGKAHEAFQRGIGAEPGSTGGPWAKSASGGQADYHTLDPQGTHKRRPGFRHELASALAWLEHGVSERGAAQANLVAYLIAAHHGRVRMGLRAMPTEAEPPEPERLFVRGIWHGETLPAVQLNGTRVPETILRLDLMQLGAGARGASWAERTLGLLEAHGPFRLAWLEALLRIADWRASRIEEDAG